MSDQNNPQESGGQVTINTQYVKDLSFENPQAPQSLTQVDGGPQIEINVATDSKALQENSYELIVKFQIRAKHGEQPAFLIDLAYGAVITLENIPAEHHQPFLFTEGARLLFPYARKVISDATQAGGFPPLMLNPIDFNQLYKARLQQEQAKQAGAATQ